MNSQTAINAPIGKVAYPSAFAAVVSICVWIAKQRGIEVPADVSISITTVGIFLIGYFVPLLPKEVR
jgi:hypothetical protein